LLPTETSLPENVPNGENIANFASAQQGANDAGGQGYYGMLPPPGDAPHHYHFQIFALDITIDLLADFSRTELLDAMSKHVLAKGETVGTYQRHPDGAR
jgi:Raf kinase inhibitor-like YbhB/YbcL family protein